MRTVPEVYQGRSTPKRNQLWRHKEGLLYMIVGFVRDPDEGEIRVAYTPAHDRADIPWCRKLSNFMNRFEPASDLQKG